MIIKTKFYDSFRCTASKCTDTCCAGWEIDVDSDTAEYYESIQGKDGAFVRERLIPCDEGVQLCREGERCRFLREDNLCELIIRLGEESLCDICREHPRFYSGVDGVTAVGVGLCCPEAAQLWLSEPCMLVCEDDGETPDKQTNEDVSRLFSLIEYITGGEGSLGERFSKLINDDGADFSVYGGLRELYCSLEFMESDFGNSFSENPKCVYDERYCRLAGYFIFRYYFELPESLCIKFAAASLIMIAAMGGELESDAKNYSKEVEYDPDNLERIYEFLLRTEGISALCRKVLMC